MAMDRYEARRTGPEHTTAHATACPAAKTHGASARAGRKRDVDGDRRWGDFERILYVSLLHNRRKSHTRGTNTQLLGQITRDMEYMANCPLRNTASDPFLISTTDPLESLLLEEGQLVSKRPHPEYEDPLLAPRLPYMPRQTAWRRRVRRILAIVAACIALLVPYLIMTLAPTQLARVITTCVCVAIFAFVAALSPFSTTKAVLTTLAYASVLIIFVGVRPVYYFAP
jgi:hypothetical protein